MVCRFTEDCKALWKLFYPHVTLLPIETHQFQSHADCQEKTGQLVSFNMSE